MVRAKFWVAVIEKVWEDKATRVVLHPVYSDSPENEKFFEATPSGEIEMVIKNDFAAQQFHMGQEFYIDFTPISADLLETS